MVVLPRPVHGWTFILVGVSRLLRGTLVRLSGAAGGTFVHASSSAPASATAVAVLDAVVQRVGPAIPHWLLQLDGACSPHTRDRLCGRLRCHQPYHTPSRSHLLT
jgi:hypothetical protein